MRRFLLILTILSVPGWSQPAQQPAQPPIVVKVEMPPESIWTSLLKVAIPTVLGAGLGAGITLYGVWLTNKRNAAENAANRQHQLEVEIARAKIAAKYKSEDNRWEFRKEVYVNLINATDDLLTGFATLLRLNAFNDASAFSAEIIPPFKTFLRHASLAPLAKADLVPSLVSAAVDAIMRVDDDGQTSSAQVRTLYGHLGALRTSLQEAGRKDLWEAPENEARIART